MFSVDIGLVRYLLQFVTFQRYENYINPARSDVDWFEAYSSDNYLHTIRLRAGGKICVCLSPVFVVKSRLREAHSCSSYVTSSVNAMLVKSLECIFHSYEWERSSSFWCSLFGVETMQAQLNGAVISIETKPSSISSESSIIL